MQLARLDIAIIARTLPLVLSAAARLPLAGSIMWRVRRST